MGLLAASLFLLALLILVAAAAVWKDLLPIRQESRTWLLVFLIGIAVVLGIAAMRAWASEIVS